MEGGGHGRRALGLHAVDLACGVQALDRTGDTRDEPATAHGDDHGLGMLELVHDLQADGALSRDDVLVVIGMHEGGARLLLQAHGLVVCVIVDAGDEAHLRSQAPGVLHLHDGGTVGHADHGPHAQAGGGQRHALGMVAGAAGDDAQGELLLGELVDLEVGASQLERARHLEVLGLEEEVGHLGDDVGGWDEVGPASDPLEDVGGMVDLVE